MVPDWLRDGNLKMVNNMDFDVEKEINTFKQDIIILNKRLVKLGHFELDAMGCVVIELIVKMELMRQAIIKSKQTKVYKSYRKNIG